MQENLQPYTHFGTIFSRGWRLFGRTLGTTFPAWLLCYALPTLVMVVAVYYGMLFLFRPVFQLLQTIFQTLLSSGFDEWAIGRAVEELFESMLWMTGEEFLRQMMQSLGWMLLALAVMIPVELVCSYVLMPLCYGAAAEAVSRGWHGVRVPFGSAFATVKGRFGKLIVLKLTYLLAALALSFCLMMVSMVASILPILGECALLLLQLALTVALNGVFLLMYLVAINENQWHFNALFAAVKRFFTDWRYAAVSVLTYLIVLAAVILLLMLEIPLMLLAMFPPVLIVLAGALAQPLYLSMLTPVYYDQRTREGYAPACGLDHSYDN